LYIVADADNWWNIYREAGNGADFEQLTFEAAEFAVPQWVFGQSTCAFAQDGSLYAIATHDGIWRLGRVDTVTGAFAPIPLGHDFFEQLQVIGTTPVVIAADAATPKRIIALADDGPRVIRAGQALPDTAVISRPESITWETDDGAYAHGLFYAPAAPDSAASAYERPPLIIKCHGGPTGATATACDARIQYWTSRGYALLDVNYRGSTGYGRAYRDQLAGAWGIADVADCVHGAAALAARDLIDPDRVLISGSSAGGYTVLCVLAFTDLAAAGASYYGIGDLVRLAASTHKFESRYLLRLIGADDARLRARSPLYHADQLSCPVLFLQGLADKVVPPDQAQTMANALVARGVPVAHVTFANERHGFRDAANIRYAIEAERSFYTRVLGIPGVDDLVELVIENSAGI
jgi:dipeptidyl aminopeptidase/acylaminoacyl peptidase